MITRRSVLAMLPFGLLAQDQPETPECSDFKEAFVEGFGKMLDGQGKQTELLQAIVEQQAKDALVLERIEKNMNRGGR